MNLSPDPARNLAALAFLTLALVWIGLRFVPVAGTPDEAVRAAIEAVHVEASVESGRLRVLGLPLAGAGGPSEAPEAAAARGALEARVAAINSDLSRRAGRLAGRLEEFEDGTVALRVAGLAVPFHDHAARRLTRTRDTATERPWLALQTLSDVLAARLEEPLQGIELESTVRRRELTRAFREIQDALAAAEAESRTAQESYHALALATATPRPDAFRRQGRGRLLEAWLAAWLAVTLRAWRRPRRALDLAVAGAAAAVAAMAALLALEDSSLLPIDARGIAPAFLPLSFAVGWAVAVLTERPIRSTPPPERTPSVPPPAERTAAPFAPAAPAAPEPPPAATPREPDLRKTARDLVERERPVRRRTPAPPPAPRSEVEVEEDPVVGPGRRAFGPPGGPQPRPPRTEGVAPPEPPAPKPTAPGRLPFFRRRRP